MVASLMSPEQFDNPYPAYHSVRADSPIAYDTTYEGWVLTRYRDVEAVLKDPEVFSSEKPLNALPSGLGARLTLLSHDPPEHSLLRSFVQKSFTTSNVGRLRPWIAALADDLLNECDAGAADFVATVAMPLPIKVLTRLFGLPNDRWDALTQWTQGVAHGEHESASYPSRKALLELYTLFRTEFLDPARHDGDGLIAALLGTTQKGRRLSTAEIMSFCMTLHIVGNETVANMLSNTLNLCIENPALWQRARTNRPLVDSIIEESLRLESPVQFVSRLVMRPVTVASVVLEPGARVILCLGAANRDPDVFAEPDRCDPSRPNGQILSFGKGIHYCLGALLARLEASILFNRMLDRYSSVHSCGPGIRHANAFFRGFKTLPVRFDA